MFKKVCDQASFWHSYEDPPGRIQFQLQSLSKTACHSQRLFETFEDARLERVILFLLWKEVFWWKQTESSHERSENERGRKTPMQTLPAEFCKQEKPQSSLVEHTRKDQTFLWPMWFILQCKTESAESYPWKACGLSSKAKASIPLQGMWKRF